MKNLFFILFNLILIHIKSIDVYKEVWEICKFELKKSGQNAFGVIDPNKLIIKSKKIKLLYELNKMKKKINTSLYFVLLYQFSGNIETLMDYLVENFKSFPLNNDHSFLIFIEKSNHSFAIKAGKYFKNLIKNQTLIEKMLSDKKELILNDSFYEIFNEIILDVYYQIGDVNYIIKTENDNYEDEEEDPFGENQYDWYYNNYIDYEDQEIYIDKEDKRKDEKINNNIYDYYNEYYNENPNENEKEKENKIKKEKEDLDENKEKNLKNNKKNNITLFKYLFILVLFILFVVFYLYLRLRKKIKIIKNNALNYVFLENKNIATNI